MTGRSEGVTGTTTFTWADGSQGIAGDLMLNYAPSATGPTSFPTTGPEYRSISTSADEILNSSFGIDAFVFAAGFGHDTIDVFQGGEGRGDVLEFDDGVFSSMQEVLSFAHQVGSDVVIDAWLNGSITLKNIELGMLHADVFRFV
jgi:hypothetical protein